MCTYEMLVKQMKYTINYSSILTTVLSFLLPNVALIKHLYSVGSGRFPLLGFGLVWPSPDKQHKINL